MACRGELRSPTNYKVSKYLKSGINIEFMPLLAFFVFCSGAVPLYSSHSQENEIQFHFSKSPACRNLFFGLFLHAEKCSEIHCIFYCPFILFNAFFSRRETWACEMPTSLATSICVLPCIKRK